MSDSPKQLAGCVVIQGANRLSGQSAVKEHREEEEVSGTARNTLILEFQASMSCLEQDNPIMPQVTAVQTAREAQLTLK